MDDNCEIIGERLFRTLFIPPLVRGELVAAELITNEKYGPSFRALFATDKRRARERGGVRNLSFNVINISRNRGNSLV